MTDEDQKTQAALVRVEQRLSQLEGSTRAALAKIDTALARHDGDIAELRASVQAIEVGLEQSDFMREADEHAIGRDDLGERLARVSAVAENRKLVIDQVREALAKHPAADGPSLVDDLRARLEHFSTKLSEARAEQETDLDAIFEALGAARVRLTGWIARDEWALAIKMAREIRAERDALKKREPIRIETADGDLAARLADVTKARDVVAEHAEIISAVAFELKRDQHDRVEVGEIVGRVQRMKAEALRLGNERNDARRAIDAIRKLAT